MILKLSEDQRQALLNHPDGPIAVADDQNNRMYVLVDKQLYDQQIQQQDVAAIQRGIEAAEEGRMAPLDEVDARIREQLGFAPRQ